MYLLILYDLCLVENAYLLYRPGLADIFLCHRVWKCSSLAIQTCPTGPAQPCKPHSLQLGDVCLYMSVYNLQGPRQIKLLLFLSGTV